MSIPPLYDEIGRHYATRRRTDPRWAAQITTALGDASSVINIGAGTGSYEPPDRSVVAVEPSEVMLAQRAPGSAPAVRAVAEHLPFPDAAFDASLALLTVHHWQDLAAGIAEMRRVAGRRIVLTYDPELHAEFWFVRDYLPELLSLEMHRVGAVADLAAAMGADRVVVLPVYRDLADGVLPAYWCRPEAYLDPIVRANCSALTLLDPRVVDEGVARLAADLRSGAWSERNTALRGLDEIDAGFRLLVSG